MARNQAITSLVHDVFKDSFGSYGAPRIKAELSKRGYRVSGPRVARIMKANNLFAGRKRRFRITTDGGHDYPLARNILNRGFTVFGKDQVRASDITYIETEQAWVYLTVIIDLFHRKVVGWSMGETLGTGDTIIPAWNMAVRSNDITKELIFRSDRGISICRLWIYRYAERSQRPYKTKYGQKR